MAQALNDNLSTDVAIIGAGQAGLAVSRLLTEQGRQHLLLERASRVAETWRSQRWDSFTMVGPNWTLRLPGFAYDGDEPDSYLSKAGIVQFFEDYVASFDPPIRFGVDVTAVDPDPSGDGFVIETSAGQMRSARVVVATGAYQEPNIPSAAREMPPTVAQLHSRDYRNPDALPAGAVLVVGTAQSGAQIAEELYRSGREVYLSVGSAGRVPRRYRGRDIVWWLVQSGFFSTPFDLLPDPKSRVEHPPHLSGVDGGRTLNLHRFARDGVRLLGRVEGYEGGVVRIAPDLHENLAKADGFAAFSMQMVDGYIAQAGIDAPPPDPEAALDDGYATSIRTELDLAAAGITSVIWATGYRNDLSWVHLPVFDERGFPIQRQGVTQVPGLYFIGMQWLHTRGSGAFFSVSDDARHIAGVIAARAEVGAAAGMETMIG